ncbi:alpha/beta fold hydrolase [Rhodanobacter ginsengisoli]|uniref:Alpha/beta fold hydrolase n=1 Tax=Rhodanobacter ginsengisoli TaxID=418646 RepID=A0ABW0QNN5_9GAMM
MPPIVLVPGLLCTSEVFAPQVAALWPHGPVTIASTLEGRTIAGIATAILDVAPPRFALAGISMGGYICFEIMRQAPERISRLALLDTSARPDTPDQTAQRRSLIAQASQENFEALLTQVYGAILHPAHQGDPVLRAINVRMGLTVGIEGMARQLEACIGRSDSRPSLPGITVPTLVLVGDSDPLIPPEHSREMAAAIPHARLVVVENCGHASTLEQPEAVNRALIEWFID